MFFEPIIVVNCSEPLWKTISMLFTTLAPKEISIFLDEKTNKKLRVKPKFILTSNPQNLDDLRLAPHLLLYIFDSANKAEYLEKDQKKIRQWSFENSRRFLPCQTIFIDDPQKTKSKSIFGDGSAYLTFLSNEHRPLQTILIKKSGEPRKKDIMANWTSLYDKLSLGLMERITYLKERIKSTPSLDILRYSFQLSYIYTDLTLNHMTIEVLNISKGIIENNPSLFSQYISGDNLAFEFDLKKDSMDFDYIIRNQSPTQYAVLYFVFRRAIECYITLESSSFVILASWDFLVNGFPVISSFFPEEPKLPLLWLADALFELQAFYENCKPLDMDERKTIFAASVSWSIKCLKELFSINPNPIPTHLQSRYKNYLSKVFLSTQSCKQEVCRLYDVLINHYSRMAMYRSLSTTLIHKADFMSDLNSDTLKIIAKGTMFSHFPFAFQKLNRETIDSLTVAERLHCCLKAIGSSCDSKIAVESLSALFSKKNIEKVSLNGMIPIYFTVSENQTQIVQNEKIVVSFICHCPFEGSIFCSRFRLVVMSQIGVYENLERKHITLQNGATIELKGSLRSPGAYQIIKAEIRAGEVCVSIYLPRTDQIIFVKEPPPLFDFSIEFPEYLLPSRWQHALLKFSVNRIAPSIELKVAGIMVQPASLFNKETGDELKPDHDNKNVSKYFGVPIGEHELYLPVHAQRSGVFKIEAFSNGKTIKKEVPYNVSEFLEFKVIYKSSSKIAQLTALSKSQCDLNINAVSFLDNENSIIENQTIGIPASVECSTRSALFILKENPEMAVVELQQKGLKPFSLRFKIDYIDDDETNEQQKKTVSPITPIIPVSLSF